VYEEQKTSFKKANSGSLALFHTNICSSHENHDKLFYREEDFKQKSHVENKHQNHTLIKTMLLEGTKR
jgi:hypothetical protein